MIKAAQSEKCVTNFYVNWVSHQTWPDPKAVSELIHLVNDAVTNVPPTNVDVAVIATLANTLCYLINGIITQCRIERGDSTRKPDHVQTLVRTLLQGLREALCAINAVLYHA